ncbi:MAG: glycosyltransferase family 4 protein [Candidatus Diapherotrites archaeon]
MRAILWLGREPSYIRHDVIIRGLRANGVELAICADTNRNMVIRFLKTLPQFIKATRKPHDFVWAGFFGHPLVPFARIFTPKPILFDAWLSSYETMVHARKSIWGKSIGALFFKWLDRFAAKCSDLTILASEGERNYFVHKLGIPAEKTAVVLIGANTENFVIQKKKKQSKTIVIFIGTFLPISGVETILRAAKHLEKNREVEIWIVGDGQMGAANRKLAEELGLQNIKFLGKKPYSEVPSLLNQADIALGIFGSGEKANRILPTKMYEAMALAKPSITARSEGVQEILTDGKSVVMVEPHDDKGLAEKIAWLAKNPQKAVEIGKNAHSIFLAKATPQKIGERIIELAKEIR